MGLRWCSGVLMCFLLACGDDGGGGGDASVGCSSDGECDDGTFCNGRERCVDGMCEPGRAPCVGECDEVGDACILDCDAGGDADGDGFRAIACGGNDCDDSDPDRYPGNTEICDESHDEDCDQTTLGGKDDDGDGVVDAICCNLALTGELSCGGDCDDSQPSVRPGETEACNGLDDDCDGDADEGLLMRLFFRDCDSDGFGDPASGFVSSCGAPASIDCEGGTWVPNDRDCDDADASRNPDAAELCDGIDTDCDGALDGPGEDDDGDGFADVACGVPAATDCDDRCAGCVPGGIEDVCDGLDQDCDGTVDEGVTTTFYRDADLDGYGSTTEVEACALELGLSTTNDDCNDGEDRVPACDSRLNCVVAPGTGGERVCGCRTTLRWEADIIDLDNGEVAVPPGPAGNDLIFRAVDGGTAVGIEIQGSGTPGVRALEPFDWLDVTAASGTGLTSSTSVRFNPYTVFIVRSGGVHNYYKLGYPTRSSSNVTFVYAPIGAIPAGFMCAAP